MENESFRRGATDRYRAALATFQPGATWDGLKSLTFWAVAAGLSADDVITDARAQGVTGRDADIRRGIETARRKVDAWNAAHADRRTARTAYRPKQKPTPPKPSRAVEDCVEAGRRGLCTTSGALMSLSPVDVRRMDAAEQRRAQLAAMFDRPDLRDLPVGIAPRSGAWIPRAGHDFMSVADWLADGTRLARAGELVKINPFTGASDERGDGKPHLATNATVAAFPNARLEFDEMPLSDQCAFWHGAITLYRLPVVDIRHVPEPVNAPGRAIPRPADCGSPSRRMRSRRHAQGATALIRCTGGNATAATAADTAADTAATATADADRRTGTHRRARRAADGQSLVRSRGTPHRGGNRRFRARLDRPPTCA